MENINDFDRLSSEQQAVQNEARYPHRIIRIFRKKIILIPTAKPATNPTGNKSRHK
jgi:hypothetical protein